MKMVTLNELVYISAEAIFWEISKDEEPRHRNYRSELTAIWGASKIKPYFRTHDKPFLLYFVYSSIKLFEHSEPKIWSFSPTSYLYSYWWYHDSHLSFSVNRLRASFFVRLLSSWGVEGLLKVYFKSQINYL